MLTLLFDGPTRELSVWTPIARRDRLADGAKWTKVPGAPMSLKQAQKLKDAGKLLLALKYEPEVELVVVKRPRHPGAQQSLPSSQITFTGPSAELVRLGCER